MKGMSNSLSLRIAPVALSRLRCGARSNPRLTVSLRIEWIGCNLFGVFGQPHDAFTQFQLRNAMGSTGRLAYNKQANKKNE